MSATPDSDRPFADFEVRLNETPDGFAVEAVVARERTVRGVMLPRDVIEAWARADDPERAAADMSQAIFAENIEDAFMQARKMADDAVRVRVNLDNVPSSFNDLPWERVRAPGDETPLARARERPFSRWIGHPAAEAHMPRRDRPLRVLVVLDGGAPLEEPVDALTEWLHLAVEYLMPWLVTELLQVTLWLPHGEQTGEASLPPGLRIVTGGAERISPMLADMHAIFAVGAGGTTPSTPAPDAPRADGLDQLLEKAGVLPPLLVTVFDAGYAQYLNTDFILGQGAQRFRDRFARGLAAYLDLPLEERLFADRTIWTDLFTALLSHGLIDVAVNQFRAGLAPKGASLDPVPVLWTNLLDGRLFAFDLSAEEIHARLTKAPAPHDPGTLLTIEDLGDRISVGGVILPKRQADVPPQPAQKASAAPEIEFGEEFVSVGDHEAPVQDYTSLDSAEATATPDALPVDALPEDALPEDAVSEDVAPDVAPERAPVSPPGHPPPGQPPPGQPLPDQSLRDQPVAQSNVIYISPAQYEPPPTDQRVTLRVNINTVTLTYAGADYTSRNLLREDHIVEALYNARDDWHRYGRTLFEAVINDVAPQHGDPQYTTDYGLRRVFDDLQTKPQNTARFELLLDRNNSELHLYQWEYLCPPDDTPLALRQASPFYRRLEGPPAALKVSGAVPKVLVAVCNPPDLQARLGLEPLDVELEQQIADTALARLADAGLLTYKILPDAQTPVVTLDALTAALQDGYHVLHLICHGFFDPSLPQAPNHLVIEREESALPLVTAAQMNALVRGAGNQLRLMVLASCQSAVDAQGSALRGLGPQLVSKGKVPAVIAMQQLLSVEAAQLFTQTYFDDLARGGRVDMALAATRLTLSQHTRMPPGAWGVPVLYMRADDGELLDVDRTAAAHVPRPPADIRSLPQMGATGDPRVRALGNLLAQQAHAVGAAELVGPLQQALRSGAHSPPAQQVEQQDRAALSAALPLTARLDAAALADYIGTTAKLELPAGAAHEIAAALNMGKHIILLGPPGTGKTSLAHAVCDYAAQVAMCRGKTVTTATADWSTFDTVGGYVPSVDQGLVFQPGNFLHAIRTGEWLVIDEINRAEIDKAFGELFTVLSGQQVDTPYRVGDARVRILPPDRAGRHGWIPRQLASRGYDYVVHPHWRIIGTMNVYDRSSLYAMSLAFMRRFAFIDLGLPERFAQLREGWVRADARLAALPVATQDELIALLAELLEPTSHLMLHRTLGPAIVADMIGYVSERHTAGAAMGDLLADAFLLFAAPQLDGLDAGAIEEIYAELDGRFGGAARRTRILERIAALYPFIRFGGGE